MADVRMPRTPLGTGPNWVTKAGGLPPILRGVARHLMANGRDESTAIATAVNWAKTMCATGTAFGGRVRVSAAAQAQACEAVARWEAMKGKSLANPCCADCAGIVDLAFTEALHPRGAGGKFAVKGGAKPAPKPRTTGHSTVSTADAQAMGLPTDPALRQSYIQAWQMLHGLPPTGRITPEQRSQMHRELAVKKAGGKGKGRGKGKGKGKQSAAARKAAQNRAVTRVERQQITRANRSNTRVDRQIAQLNRNAPKVSSAPLAPGRISRTQNQATRARQLLAASRNLTADPATPVDLAGTVTATTDSPTLTIPTMMGARMKGAMPPLPGTDRPRYPINNHTDLKRAIKAVGRAKGDHAKVRRHIIRRARAVGGTHLIPGHWKSDGTTK